LSHGEGGYYNAGKHLNAPTQAIHPYFRALGQFPTSMKLPNLEGIIILLPKDLGYHDFK
jgi:hypothetical protein